MFNETTIIEDDVIYLEHFDANRTRLRHIGNIVKGPFWVAGGFSENSNFINGFFYGMVVINGQINGKKN